ncbi:FAD-dependent oxidoreductase [Limosilactobacillus sp.]|jgi:2,4-dienoyl-CoA reductase-like NADH-dependent reductase (Old Yellow Enzyme family)/thioredoxin reductase|uniref:FAD-dependent oxidoreductase n=1 Tax=Limosilactobacillus sp. TaxID=2773925 RepID=UPI0025BB9E38|nr:FAD-dependent oxidoreductase [Limosilactobacillus sp.]MCH3922752.1 FAD-dependent oxidoreductase [Limosilactobacillus sp.]MCH3927435.1 FAD-dependent oxidoreductase [Limosilactobacillus sp.]
MQNKHYPKLFSPFHIGHVQLKNRIVMPPLATNLGQDGFVTPELLDYFEARAKGGAGLIYTGNCSVDYPRGKDVANQLRVDDMKYCAGLNNLVERVHAYDAKIFCQIHQGGNQTTMEHSEGVPLVSPSGVPSPVCKTQPRVMSNAEVWEMINKFAKAAHWVKVAGFDGIEIFGGHGYLIEQFMSPATNFRHDEFGGSFENRMRFPLEIVKAVRREVGYDFPIDFRISVDEFTDPGYHLEEGVKMCKVLEEAGVDMLHVSGGYYGSMERTFETQTFPQADKVYLAEAVKKVVNIPVITVGNIRTPDVAESILEKGQADLVALGRTLIADPDWPNKARLGHADQIRRCINCLHCQGDTIHPGLGMRCTVNPLVGYESEYKHLFKTTEPKKVMVIGGGPAGMTAAYSAAKRGHHVTLYEQDDKLGGQMNIAAVPPHKEIVKEVGKWQAGEMKRCHVTVKTGIKVDKALIESFKPDAVILATGSVPSVPPIDGIEKTISSWDLLKGTAEVTAKNVIVLGGGETGSEVADLLAQEGHQVTIMDMLPELTMKRERVSRGEFLRNLKKEGVKSVLNAVATKITDDGIHYVAKHSGRNGFVPGEQIVLALGQHPVTDLQDSLDELEIPYQVIGDAFMVRNIASANRMGFDAGQHID